MNILLILIFFWSLMLGLYQWSQAVASIILGLYGQWSVHCLNAFIYTVLCIDSFLRIFSPTHTGLW